MTSGSAGAPSYRKALRRRSSRLGSPGSTPYRKATGLMVKPAVVPRILFVRAT